MNIGSPTAATDMHLLGDAGHQSQAAPQPPTAVAGPATAEPSKPRTHMPSMQAALLRQIANRQSAADNAARSGIAMAPPPPPPPPPPVASAGSKPRAAVAPAKKWVVAEGPAIHAQQGPGYPLFTSFALTLKDRGMTHGDARLGDAEFKAEFIADWKNKVGSTGMMNSHDAGNIDGDKFDHVIGKLRAMENEWDSYPKSDAPQTFRGDKLDIADSYPWLRDIISQPLGSAISTQQLNQDETAPTIMSTSTDKNCSYANDKTVLWKFSLPEGKHRGIAESLYKSENEVTFPMYNQIKVKSVTSIPPGLSFDSPTNGTGFGTAHRYVIEAEMQPKPAASGRAARTAVLAAENA